MTGYTINQAARSLRKRASNTILVALPDIGNPFFSRILEAVEREAAARQFNVLVANRRPETDQATRLLDYMQSNSADGILLFDGSLDLERFRGLARDSAHMPLVVACEDIPGSGLATVKTDNVCAGRRATEHLLSLGHRRIAHLLGPSGNVLTTERLQGYSEALSAAGLPIEREWIIPGDFHMENGAEAAQRFRESESPPTAIFCANDEMAIGFISEMQRHGYLCPRDVSVVGFDDITLAARYHPPLTTMRQPTEELGHISAMTLLDILEGKRAANAPREIILESQLVVRESTAPPSHG